MEHKDHCLRCMASPCVCAVVEYVAKQEIQQDQGVVVIDNEVKGCAGDCDECINPC